MKIRFAVGPHAGSLSGAEMTAFSEALELDGARRGDILEEVLGLVRGWWAGETVDHRSNRWTFDHLAPAARPVQDPLEVWLGGRGPQALDRVGRIAPVDDLLSSTCRPDRGPAPADHLL